MIAEKHYEDNKARDNQPVGTPMHRLLRDPYIAIIAGALVGKQNDMIIKVHISIRVIYFSCKYSASISGAYNR